MQNVFITQDEISAARFQTEFEIPVNCGAVLWFEGRVRDHNQEKQVGRMNYECYQDMAISECELLMEEVKQKWNISKIFVAHRTGMLELGEASFVVALCSAHRKQAIEALDYFIDTFKKRVPIWKQEFDQSGNYDWIV